jgi:hypothetical protein
VNAVRNFCAAPLNRLIENRQTVGGVFLAYADPVECAGAIGKYQGRTPGGDA